MYAAMYNDINYLSMSDTNINLQGYIHMFI